MTLNRAKHWLPLRASSHPRNFFFFFNQKHFFIFLLQIFRSISLKYGHIWYQNDGNEMFFQTIKCIFKNIYSWIFSDFFFIIFRYIFCHSDLDLWPKVTNFNRVWANVLSNHLAKTASKSVHPFGWNFVHKNSAGHTDRQTDTHINTHTHTEKLQWKYNPSTISWRCNDTFGSMQIFEHTFFRKKISAHINLAIWKKNI